MANFKYLGASVNMTPQCILQTQQNVSTKTAESTLVSSNDSDKNK